MGRRAAQRSKEILNERVAILVGSALSNAGINDALASRQAYMARRICSRHRLRMPYHMRMLYCRRCKSFIVPGLTSRVRIGRSGIRSIRTTCGFCGFVYRKILASAPASKEAPDSGPASAAALPPTRSLA